MTWSYVCVLLAGFMPLLFTGYAKFTGPGFNNRRPRDFLAGLEGARQRANAAQQNSFEAFPLFAASARRYCGKKVIARTHGDSRSITASALRKP